MSGGDIRHKARDIPDAIAWSKGMKITPQSLRYFDRRIEGHLAYFGSTVLPYRWGVFDYAISQEDLAGDRFSVERLEAVMPDGLVVWYRAPDGPPLAMDLSVHRELLETGPCTIHLAVVAAQGAFDSEPGPKRLAPIVRQVMQDDHLFDLPCLRPVLNLILTRVGEDPPPRFASMPLQKVRLQEGKVCVVPNDPPLVALRRGFEAYKIVFEAIECARMTIGNLMRLKSPDGARSPEATTVRGMIMPLLKMEAMLAQGVCHPFDIHLAFVDVLGALAIEGEHMPSAPFPAYDHVDPLGSFNRLADELRECLARLDSKFEEIPFTASSDGRFTLRVEERFRRDHLYVQLFASPGQPIWQVEQWARRALIGDQDRMAQIREARALGAPRAVIEREQKIDLLRASDAVLLRIPLRTSAQPSGLHISDGGVVAIEGEITGDRTGRPANVVLYLRKANRDPVD